MLYFDSGPNLLNIQRTPSMTYYPSSPISGMWSFISLMPPSIIMSTCPLHSIIQICVNASNEAAANLTLGLLITWSLWHLGHRVAYAVYHISMFLFVFFIFFFHFFSKYFLMQDCGNPCVLAKKLMCCLLLSHQYDIAWFYFNFFTYCFWL